MRFLVVACCLVSQLAFGQQSALPDAEKEIASRFGNTITAEKLKKQVYKLASDEMEGRETATAGQEKAAAYIAGEFAQVGLQPGANGKWQQPYTLYNDSLTAAAITLEKDQHFVLGRDFWVDIRSGINLDTIVNEYTWLNDGTDMEYLGQSVAGKVVVINEAAARGVNSLNERVELAAAKGVTALLVISSYSSRFSNPKGLKSYTTGIYQKGPGFSQINVYYISPSVAARLKKAPADAVNPVVRKMSLRLVFKKQVTELHPSNVLGILEGTDKKDEYVFITAHYDHLGKDGHTVYYGADDDASGTSAVIEIARAFAAASKEGHGPRRSLVFMTVSGEEKGLLGSTHYTSSPVYPLASTVTDLNIDMIGRIDPAHEKDSNYIYIIGDNRLSSELRTINESANATFTNLQLDYKYNDPEDPEAFYYRSDHYMFARRGIPIIFYFNGTHADYHQPTDTPDKIDYPLLARRARLVFYTAWMVANREERLVVDGIPQ